MKKFLAVLTAGVIFATSVIALTGCGAQNGGNTAETQQSSDAKSETKKESKNRKYENIDAESTPVGVDEVSFKNVQSGGDNYVDLVCRIYKNSASPAKSTVSVTFELYNDTGEYIGKKTMTPKDMLSEGEDARVEDSIIFETRDQYYRNIPDENVKKYSAKICKIEEKDSDEVELAKTKKDIESAITWDHDYKKAQVLLDDALQKYPDDKDLKLLQAELEDAQSKK